MQALKTSSRLVAPARRAVAVRCFVDSKDPASKDMSKKNWAGEKINSGSSDKDAKNPFEREEDLHAVGLDEQARAAIKASLFPKDESKNTGRPVDWSKDEQKMYQHPVRSGIDKLAEGVESRGAKASENFSAPKGVADTAANFAKGADKYAHAGDKVIENATNVKSNLSSVGQRIADMSHAPSIGNDPSSEIKTTTASMGMGSGETREKTGSASSGVADSLMGGMGKLTEKMSNMGGSIAEKMKPLEGLADKMPTGSPHMPKAVENIKESVMKSAESIKESLPKSINEAKETLSKSMPSMDSIKDMANSAKDSVKSMADSAKDAMPNLSKSASEAKDSVKGAAYSAKGAVENAMPSKDSAKGAAYSAKGAVENAMPSMDSVKGAAYSAKGAVENAMPSMDSVKGAAYSAKGAVESSLPSMDSVKGAAYSAKGAVENAMPSMDSVKGAAYSATGAVKNAMPSMDSVKGAAYSATSAVKDAMPSMDSVKSAAYNSKDTLNATVEKATQSNVIDQFKQGMASVKEAMKPIVDYSSEKIREGAAVAAEKIPPLASSIKENIVAGATTVMNSKTVESLKDSVTSSAKGAYEKAKDSASSVITGKSDAAKMDIKEQTVTKSTKTAAKDQEMSSSDIYKP